MRRAVCLRAIDEGAITTLRELARIDGIFGANLASGLATKKEGRSVATIDLAPRAVPAQESATTISPGWFLAVDYDYQGLIQNYYLSNLHK